MAVTDAPASVFQNKGFGTFVTTNAVVAAQDGDQLFTWDAEEERFAGYAVRGAVAKGKIPVLGDVPTLGRVFSDGCRPSAWIL